MHDTHFKWILLISNIFSNFSTIPGHSFGINMFIPYWINDLKITNFYISILWLLSCIISGIYTTYLGKIVDTYGVRKTSCILYPLYMICLYSMPFVYDVYIFSFIFCLIRILGPETIYTITYVSNTQWFDKLGKVFSIISIFDTIMISTPLLINYLIKLYGWRNAFLYFTIILNILLLPNYIIIKNKITNRVIFENNQVINYDTSISYKNVIKKPHYWCMVLNGFLLNIINVGFTINIIQFINTYYNKNTYIINYIFPCITIGSTISCVLIGGIYDYFSFKYNMRIFYTLEFLLILILLKTMYFFNIYTLSISFFLYGFIMGSITTSYGILYPKLYGKKEIGSIFSLHNGIVLIGGGLGPLFFNLCFTTTNNYSLIIISIVILKSLSFIIYYKYWPNCDEEIQ